MDSITLLHTFRDALAGNQAIRNWAQQNFGRDHKVFVGADMQNLPGVDDTPLFYLFVAEFEGGQDDDEQTHGMVLVSEIWNEDSEVLAAMPNVTEYTGVVQIGALRVLARTAIEAALPGTMSIKKLETSFSPPDEFPYFQCEDFYIFDLDLYQGDDPFD